MICAEVRLSPISKPHHINSIFTVNTPILYIYCNKIMFTHLSTFKLNDQIKPTSSAALSSQDSYVSPVKLWYSGNGMCSATGALFLANL